MRELCSVNNENHFAIRSENKEQDEELLRDTVGSLPIHPDTAHANSPCSDKRKNLESTGKADRGQGGRDNDNEAGAKNLKHRNYEKTKGSESASVEEIDLSDEVQTHGEREIETAMTILRTERRRQELSGNESTLNSKIKLIKGSSRRKRKLDSFKSTPSDDAEATWNKDLSKRNRLISSCRSYRDEYNRDVPYPEQRQGSWLVYEDFNKCSENVVEVLSDDCYNGVDDIEPSEDESQLTLLEEKYIIDSELRSIRGHRSVFHGDDSRQPVSESDFPELFGHPDDSVPTYTSDAGFLYETSFPSSRRYYDNPAKRVRFEDHTRITDLYVQNIDVSDSDLNSDVQPDHTALRARYMANPSCDGENNMMCNSDDVKGEVQGCMGTDDDDHMNAVQSASTSVCDDSDLFEASLSDFDSDGGDTTDEEDPPAHAYIHNPHSKLQRKLSPILSGRKSNKIFTNSRSLRRNGPVMGQFVVDPRKAVVVLDNRKLKLFPARLPRASRSSTDSSDSTSNEYYQPSRQLHDVMTQNPLKFFGSTPLDVMLCGLFTSATGPDSLRGQVIGPPEAFYPFTTVTVNGTIASNDDDLYDYEDNDESIKNFHELIDLGDASDIDFGRDTSTELANGTCDLVRPKLLAENDTNR